MQLTGAEIVIECLKEQGVDTVFGYPGGTILNIYDALYKHSDEINHVLTSHEQGASHAADGYARATGKVGVCMATSGPGATNLVTGIATAYMDSVPMVAITANVNLPLLGKDTFQEIDIAGVTMPITKHGYIVKDVNVLADTIRKAFKIAKTGRPGPVLVDITKDVTANVCEYTPVVPEEIKTVNRYTESDLEKAVALIRQAKKPYIYLGGGAIISDAAKEVREFAELIDAPVCDTLMGKGAFDGKSERYTGMIGMHGTKASNLGVSDCDLLIALGARFSDRVTGNPKKFAEGANDTGVIVSYNTEGLGNKEQFNCVVQEGAISINPINWKRDDTYASKEENLGSLSAEGEIEYHKADARVDTERGVVICESIESDAESQAIMQEYFGPDSYHLQDYSLYFMNLRQNVADRIEAFEK